jgi:hypothetical protein
MDTQARIQILLAEYTTLRTEATHRTNNLFQLVAVAAGMVAWATSRDERSLPFWIILSVSVAVVMFCIWCIERDIYFAGKRMCELEKDINALATEVLLRWETSCGGLKKYLPWKQPLPPVLLKSNAAASGK